MESVLEYEEHCCKRRACVCQFVSYVLNVVVMKFSIDSKY